MPLVYNITYVGQIVNCAYVSNAFATVCIQAEEISNLLCKQPDFVIPFSTVLAHCSGNTVLLSVIPQRLLRLKQPHLSHGRQRPPRQHSGQQLTNSINLMTWLISTIPRQLAHRLPAGMSIGPEISRANQTARKRGKLLLRVLYGLCK